MANSKCSVCREALVLVALAMLVANVYAEITCEEVTNFLTPCIGYAILGGSVPPECCAGIKALNAASKTSQDRRDACTCVKDGAANIPGLNYDLVATLPEKCGTTCPYTLSPTTDCSRVN